jgi:predicted kinase
MKPKLILIRGPAGSGKSTLAPLVAKKIKEKTVVIPKDPIMCRFSFFNLNENLKSDEVLNVLTEAYLKKKVNIVIESVFGGKNSKKRIDKFKQLAKKNKAEFYLINIDVDLKTCIARDNKRDKKISKKQVSKVHAYHYLQPAKDGFILNNNCISKSKAVNEIVKYIRVGR